MDYIKLSDIGPIKVNIRDYVYKYAIVYLFTIYKKKDTKSGFIIWKFLLRRDDQESPPWMAQCKQLITKRGLRMIESEKNVTQKRVRYNIPCHIQRLIKRDVKNKRLWDEIKKMEFWSEYEFLHYLFDTAVTCSSNVCSKPIKVN